MLEKINFIKSVKSIGEISLIKFLYFVCLCRLYEYTGSVAKLKLYANLYKTIKVNIILTVKSFVSINYFSFFQYKYYLIFNFAIAPSYLYALNL